MTYRIHVADKLSKEGLAVLESNSEVEIVDTPTEAEGLIVRSATKVTGDYLAGATKLKVVARAGIGVDNIDIPACTKAGVVVENTPLGNATSAAEHAFALLISLARQIPQAHATMREGKWDKSKFEGVELEAKTLGVIGAGNIGAIMCRKARGFGMRVVVYDPYLDDKRAKELGVELASLEDTCAQADAISVHMPLVDATRGLIGEKALAKVGPGALLVQASRGGVVSEAAVISALETGRLRGAAFDVFEEEPLAADHPLRSRDDVVLTPHLGASTVDAQIHVGVQAAEQVIAFLSRGERINALN